MGWKILARGVGIIPTPGKPNSEIFVFSGEVGRGGMAVAGPPGAAAQVVAAKSVNKSNAMHATWNCIVGTERGKAEPSEGIFQCGKCKLWKVRFAMAQTRSGDEPMTVFCTCVNCGNRWKFS